MAQSLSNVLLHIIFSTKQRRPFITPNIESELYAYITTLVSAQGSYMHKIGGIEDHIHLLVTLPRTISISTLLEELKKNSSKWIKSKGNQFRDFSWQKGFGAFSVSITHQKAVEKYIATQKDHHKTISFQDEFRKLLTLHKISYNEEYVWD